MNRGIPAYMLPFIIPPTPVGLMALVRKQTEEEKRAVAERKIRLSVEKKLQLAFTRARQLSMSPFDYVLERMNNSVEII
jgi:hypothetical protein